VTKFLSGFACATVLWAGVAAYAHVRLRWGPPAEPEAVDTTEAAVADAPPLEETPVRRRSSRSGRRRSEPDAESAAVGAAGGDVVTGDDLREDEPRMIDGDGTGGEQQLSGGQVEAAFDGAMGRVRRCFLLVEGDAPLRGRLTFGLRIAPSGRVGAVQLSGPTSLTSGDAGQCLRDAARTMAFPSFDGPEMVVRYPIVLE